MLFKGEKKSPAQIQYHFTVTGKEVHHVGEQGDIFPHTFSCNYLNLFLSLSFPFLVPVVTSACENSTTGTAHLKSTLLLGHLSYIKK